MGHEALIKDWYKNRGWKSFPFQQEVMQSYLNGESGLLNAPTGSGKTFAIWLPVLAEYIRNNPTNYQVPKKNGLQILWITPLRALAKDIQIAMQEACNEFGIPWTIGLRTGDTTSSEKNKQKKGLPECLITTPESLHVLLSQKGYPDLFKNLKSVVVDEWHELLATKRGVQIELGLSRLKRIVKNPLKIWGVSATIGNLEEGLHVLLGAGYENNNSRIIRADIKKNIQVETILPEEIEKFPWAGHLGIKLLPEILKVIEASTTTLVFTNTRSQTEIWYQYILLEAPHLAGAIALHHGSLDNDVRRWVEQALHEGKLKAVVCTSSLDLGVDFRPVESVVQIGGPKGIARFLQRAGRSGHHPGATSRIWFVPTNSLELLEAAALKTAVSEGNVESRKPLELTFDVLIQYLVTLAVSEGFTEENIFKEVKSTFAFRKITKQQWKWVIDFLCKGGKSLGSYEEYSKLVKEGKLYKVENKRIAMRHRMSIGTIVGDPVLKIKYMTGGFIGTIEESFFSKLNPGDVFWFAGKNLEYVKIYEMTVLVKKAGSKRGVIPRWYGGRMPLSSKMARLIREKVSRSSNPGNEPELQKLQPLMNIQKMWSHVPSESELLIEKIKTREGYHVFIYPFEGRYVHEILGAVLVQRISGVSPYSFSIAMNDYGLELLSNNPIPIEESLENGLLSYKDFLTDLRKSLNNSEMASRKFRDIATISGLIFHGYPNQGIKNRHLHASAKLFFDVFQKYEPDNLLLDQAYDEVMNMQLEKSRMIETIQRLSKQKVVITEPPKPTPFAFPILVDRLREHMSFEKLEDRVSKMQLMLEKSVEIDESAKSKKLETKRSKV